MGIASRAGDWAFKAFTAGLGVTTIYLTATFSVNVYRGLAWHKAQSVRTLLLFSFFFFFSFWFWVSHLLVDWMEADLVAYIRLLCCLRFISVGSDCFFTVLVVIVLLNMAVDWWYLYNFWTICKHSVWRLQCNSNFLQQSMLCFIHYWKFSCFRVLIR